MDTNQVRLLCILLLVWSAALVLNVGARDINVKTSDEENVVAYWERKLAGANLPSSIRSTVTPLSSKEATQLVKSLPKDVATFCKASRIKCGNNLNPIPTNNVNAIPFYHSGDPNNPNAIPFYHSGDPIPTNNPDDIHSGDTKNLNAIPFYHSGDPIPTNSPNAIPFYHSGDTNSPNAILFYHSGDPIPTNNPNAIHSGDPKNLNAIPFYHSKDPIPINNPNAIHSADTKNLNAIPFYHSGDPIPTNNPNAIPFYHSGDTKNLNAIPFYHSGDPIPTTNPNVVHSGDNKNLNAIPFYHSGDTNNLNAIPFYHSEDPIPTNNPDVVHSGDTKNLNAIPFYHSGDPIPTNNPNAIPFYHSGDTNNLNAIPFYHSGDPIPTNNPDAIHSGDTKNLNAIPFYHSGDPIPTNNPEAIPFYHSGDANNLNAIPFYHSGDPIPTNNLDSTSTKSAQVPRFLVSPIVPRQVGSAFREKQVLVSGLRIYVGLASDGRSGVDERAFLPRKLAKLFTFDNEGEKIASMLEVSKESLQETIHICEAQSKNDYMHAEEKACLASLEDVVDFVSNIMGSTKPVKVYDSLFNASSATFVGKTFTVLNVETLKQDDHEPSVSCHDMDFPFRVFYCHYAKQSKSFVATLEAEDGSIQKRIVNCHYDTSYWNPHHTAFKQLHTKPGEGEVCHWLGKTWMEENGWLFMHA